LLKSNGKKEVIDKIQKWLNDESIDFTTEENSYLDFRINIKDPNQTIFSYKDKPDSIEFGTYSSLDEEYKKAFVALKNNKEKLQILCDLECSLLEINVGHKLVPSYKNLEKVEIFKKIYFDGLTKDKFMDTIFALQRGSKLVELMFRQLSGKYYLNSTSTFIL
jgi:hypothetical protein